MVNLSITEFKCRKCGVTKPLYMFGKREKNKLGINYVCKDCKKIYDKELKEKHIEDNDGIVLPQTFICKRCQQKKNIDSFDIKKSYKLGHSTICNDCKNERFKCRIIPDEKVCSICGNLLPIESFTKNKINKDGHMSWCKKCNAIKERMYRDGLTKEQKDKYIEYHKKKKIEKLDYINNILVNKGCSICGYNKSPAALEFHHKNPNEKFKEVSYLVTHGFNKEAIDKEIEKCDIVCANCHREITAKERNRYK